MTLRPAAPLLPALLAVGLAAGAPGSLLHPAPSAAQARTVASRPLPTAPRLRSLPASTRAMALGNAYMMDAGHADALFYHPALLTGAGGFGLDVQSWGGESSAASASAAVGWLGGGVGIGLQTLQGSTPDPLLLPGQAALLSAHATPISERIATVGYARRVVGIQVGAAARLVESRVGGFSSSVVAVDVGAARTLGPVTVGLTVQDVGEELFQVDDGIGAARVVLGAGAYGRQVGPLDVGFTGALTYTADGTRVGGGLEVGYWPVNGRTFVARVGLQDHGDDEEADPLTLGFAFWGDDLVLEWAVQRFGDLGSAHRFGVRWR